MAVKLGTLNCEVDKFCDLSEDCLIFHCFKQAKLGATLPMTLWWVTGVP